MIWATLDHPSTTDCWRWCEREHRPPLIAVGSGQARTDDTRHFSRDRVASDQRRNTALRCDAALDGQPGGSMDGEVTDDGSSHDQLRQRGLELQAALPVPSGWGARWRDRRRPSEGAEVAEGTVDLALVGGLRGVLLAIPAVLIWIVRRLRQGAG